MFDACYNCGRFAVHTVEVRRDGKVHDEAKVCAYCVDGAKVPRGFSKFVDGERVTGDVQQ